MKTLSYLAAAIVSAGLMAAPASATTFIFKSGGAFTDTPVDGINVVMDCGTVENDLCTSDDAAGFRYAKDGVGFTATSYDANGAVTLIQDIFPENSGLGALSEADQTQDQIQTNSGEYIEFVFDAAVTLSNIEFNAGDDVDCSAPGPEGGCGFFNLYIDNFLQGVFEATDLVAGGWLGTTFRFEPITAGAGFTIAQFEVSDVPIPAALPLLLSGLAGLGFASRRKKAAA